MERGRDVQVDDGMPRSKIQVLSCFTSFNNPYLLF